MHTFLSMQTSHVLGYRCGIHCFQRPLMMSHTCKKRTSAQTHTQTHRYTGVAEVSRAVHRVNPCPFSPPLCECCSDRGATGWSMCLLREILFTGINAFCSQASARTLGGGLLWAGTCTGSLSCCFCFMFDEVLDSDIVQHRSTLLSKMTWGYLLYVFFMRSVTTHPHISKAVLHFHWKRKITTQLFEWRETWAVPRGQITLIGRSVRWLAGWRAGWRGVSLLLP